MVISFLIKPMFPGLLPVKVTYEDWANFIEQNKKMICNADDISW